MKKLRLLIFLLLFSVCFAQNITKETDHFIFNGEQKDITEEVINICENQYNEIAKKISKEPAEKISITIYPDQITLLKNCNNENSTPYFIAMFDNENNNIHMVSPYNPGPVHSFLSVTAALMAHIECSFLNIYYDFPIWLIEAIHSYSRIKMLEEDQLFKQNIQEGFQRILEKEDNFKIINIKQSLFVNFEKEYKFGNKEEAIKKAFEKTALCISFIQYILDNWGYERLLQFSEEKSIYDIFGMQTQEFEKNWFEYIKNNNYL